MALIERERERETHFKGRWSPQTYHMVSHHHVRSNKNPNNKEPIKDNPLNHLTKDHPHPTEQESTKVPNNLHMLMFPIPCDFHPIPSTKDIPSPPNLVKTFEKGLVWVGIILNQFNHPSPSHLGIHNEIIPNKVFNLGFMPLFFGWTPFNYAQFKSSKA